MKKEQNRSTAVARGERNDCVDAESAQKHDNTNHGWIKARSGGGGIEKLCKVRNKLSGTQAISLRSLVQFCGKPTLGLER